MDDEEVKESEDADLAINMERSEDIQVSNDSPSPINPSLLPQGGAGMTKSL